jgi:hypothetical protein
MKTLFPLFLFVTSAGLAQLAVYDPANHLVNVAMQSAQQANHVEVLRQWAAQLESLNRQIRELQDQLAVQRRIRDVMGDPSAAGAQMVLRDLGANDLARTYGETLQAVQRLANAAASLRRTTEGVFASLDDRTVLNRTFVRQEPRYRRYAAVERQADNFSSVVTETSARTASVQADIAETLGALRTASTQAEVDKLNGKLAVLNGQLTQLAALRREEADKLQVQQILNENQAAKEQQDLLEKQGAEERQTLDVVNAWQQGFTLTPTRYTWP